MRPSLLLLFLGVSFCASAQKLPEIGMNVRIIAPDKTIVAEIRPVSSTTDIEPSATYYWYSAGQIHLTQGGYSGKLLNGTYNEYYLNKNLKEQGSFSRGLKNGAWKTWTENGALIQFFTFKKSERYGTFALYDDKGKLLQSGKYNHNQLNGKIKNYRGDSIAVDRYKNGKLLPQNTTGSFWNKLNIFKKKTRRVAKPAKAKP